MQPRIKKKDMYLATKFPTKSENVCVSISDLFFVMESHYARSNFRDNKKILKEAFSMKQMYRLYNASSIIRTSFIRHSIIRPLGQIIIYDITMKCYFHTILLKTC